MVPNVEGFMAYRNGWHQGLEDRRQRMNGGPPVDTDRSGYAGGQNDWWWCGYHDGVNERPPRFEIQRVA